MGCRIIVGKDDDGLGVECACFYDSVTETVFGPKMSDLEEAESFQKWLGSDPREIKLITLRHLYDGFVEQREEAISGKKEDNCELCGKPFTGEYHASDQCVVNIVEDDSNYWKDTYGGIK